MHVFKVDGGGGGVGGGRVGGGGVRGGGVGGGGRWPFATRRSVRLLFEGVLQDIPLKSFHI